MKTVFKKPGLYTGALYVIAAGCLIQQLIQLQILKSKYVVAVVMGIVLNAAILFFMVFAKKAKRAIKIIGNHTSALWVQRIFGAHGVMAFS